MLRELTYEAYNNRAVYLSVRLYHQAKLKRSKYTEINIINVYLSE